MIGRQALLAALAILAVPSCAYLPSAVPSAAYPSAPHLVALDTEQCRALLNDDASIDALQQAAARSIEFLRTRPLDRSVTVFDHPVTTQELLSTLDTVSHVAGPTADLCDQLRLYRIDAPERLLVTGYYQPELAASRKRTERFRYPLYRVPADLVDVELRLFCPACAGQIAQGRVDDGQLIPYYSRAEIDAGALAGRGYEMAWLDDPVEVFFLQIQGSAMLHYPDGVHMQIGYAASNGRPYTSLGRVLVEQGKLAKDTISLAVVKDYLHSHPDEQAALMALNERYIFFRAVPDGPIGSLGVPLTAGRSIAADARVYPPGAAVLLRMPPRDGSSGAGMSRMTFIQDAGVAITGPSRVDVFWGTGSTAEAIAGEMHDPGELYLLLPQ